MADRAQAVRCLECDQAVESTVIVTHVVPGIASPRPAMVTRPCMHTAGLLFDFTTEPEEET